MNTESTFNPAVRASEEKRRIVTWSGLAGCLAPIPFAATAVLLSWADSSYLRDYGWTVANHHGVPWPSSLAIGPHGWLMVLAFAVTGALVVVLGAGLRHALPANRSGGLASKAVVLLGAALGLSAFPVNRPQDAADVLSWTTSWHGRVHLVAFLLTIIASLIAAVSTAVATRPDPSWRDCSKLSAFVAALLGVSLTLPSSWAWAWYLFLATLLAWLASLASRLRRLATTTAAAATARGDQAR